MKQVVPMPAKKYMVLLLGLMLVLSTFLMGCGVNAGEDVAKKETPKSKDQEFWGYKVPSYDFAVSDTHVYFAEDRKIVSLNKETLEKEEIEQNVEAGSFTFWEDTLYYFDDSSRAIYKTDPNTKKKMAIWKEAEWAPRFENSFEYGFVDIGRFEIYKGRLYIPTSGTSIIVFDPKLNTTEGFLPDVSTHCFMGDEVYFTDHADRTWTLYKKSISGGKITKVRGLGEYVEKGTELPNPMIDNVVATNNAVYYSTRFPHVIYQLSSKEKDDRVVVASEDYYIKYMSSHESTLYYLMEEEGTFDGWRPSDKLFEFKEGKAAFVTTLTFKRGESNFKIMDGHAFFETYASDQEGKPRVFSLDYEPLKKEIKANTKTYSLDETKELLNEYKLSEEHRPLVGFGSISNSIHSSYEAALLAVREYGESAGKDIPLKQLLEERYASVKVLTFPKGKKYLVFISDAKKDELGGSTTVIDPENGDTITLPGE